MVLIKYLTYFSLFLCFSTLAEGGYEDATCGDAILRNENDVEA